MAVKKFMDKRLLVHIQGARRVTGVLRGFDIFLNLVLDQARDESIPGREERMEGGMVVRLLWLTFQIYVHADFDALCMQHQVVRGNSVASIEIVHA